MPFYWGFYVNRMSTEEFTRPLGRDEGFRDLWLFGLSSPPLKLPCSPLLPPLFAGLTFFMSTGLRHWLAAISALLTQNLKGTLGIDNGFKK